jgi:hypothetical protein
MNIHHLYALACTRSTHYVVSCIIFCIVRDKLGCISIYETGYTERDMAKVNVTEAAKLAGIGRAHLYRKYLSPKDKAGKILPPLISAEKDHQGNTVIDTSELLRVFGKLSEYTGDTVSRELRLQEETQKRDTISTALAAEVTALHEHLAAAREQINALKDDKEWLKGQVANLTDTLKRIEHKPEPVPHYEHTSLPESLPTTPVPVRRSWWKLWGG